MHLIPLGDCCYMLLHLKYCYNNLFEGQVKFRLSHYSQIKHARSREAKLAPADAPFALLIYLVGTCNFSLAVEIM